MKKKYLLAGEEIEIDLQQNSSSEIRFLWQGKEYVFSTKKVKKNPLHFHKIGSATVYLHRREVTIEELSLRGAKKNAQHEGDLVAPMPGKIFKILKKVGDNVEKGETLLILEAMKMEHAIKANRAGKVSSMMFKEGALVQMGQELVKIE